MIFYLSRQASCLLVISRVGPEKKNTIVAAHTWTGLNVSFVRFYIFIDLDFVSVGKNGPKKRTWPISGSFCRYRGTDYLQHKKRLS